jgi:hypothetical protein
MKGSIYSNLCFIQYEQASIQLNWIQINFLQSDKIWIPDRIASGFFGHLRSRPPDPRRGFKPYVYDR